MKSANEQKNNKLADFSELAPKTQRKFNKKQRNLLGYLVFCHNGYSKHRFVNNDWFFVSDRELLTETGIGSFTTLHVWMDIFILEGIISKRTGDKKNSNQYRFSDEYRDEKFDYVPAVNFNTQHIESDTITEKSVAPQSKSVAPQSKSVAPNCSTSTSVAPFFGSQPIESDTITEKSVAPTETTEKETKNEKVDFWTQQIESEDDTEETVAPNCSTDKEKDKEKEKERSYEVIVNKSDSQFKLHNVTVNKSDSHCGKDDCVDWTYDGEINLELPQWMDEVEPTEPFEQYTQEPQQKKEQSQDVDNCVFSDLDLDNLNGNDMKRTTKKTTETKVSSQTRENKRKATAKETTQAVETRAKETEKTTHQATKSWKREIDNCYEQRKQVPQADRAAARKWYWEKWNKFCDTLNDRTIEENIVWFKWFYSRLCIVASQEWYKQQRESQKNQFRTLYTQRWWVDVNALVDEIKNNPTDYLKNPKRYSTEFTRLKQLLRENYPTNSGEYAKNVQVAEWKYTDATKPLLEEITVADPDKENSTSNDYIDISDVMFLDLMTTDTKKVSVNPSTYDPQTNAYYYNGE